MNGIHDMGGMHGMGPIRREEDEPVFHEPWESRVFALRRATGFLGKWNHVYSVRFPARELWGENSRAEESVYIDLWEDYLEPE